MANLGWLLAAFFCVCWLIAEYQFFRMRKIAQEYEQHLRRALVPYDKIYRDLYDSLAPYKARAIVKKSEKHKLNPLKVVDE